MYAIRMYMILMQE